MDWKTIIGMILGTGIPSEVLSNYITTASPIAATAQDIQQVVAPDWNPITQDYGISEALMGGMPSGSNITTGVFDTTPDLGAGAGAGGGGDGGGGSTPDGGDGDGGQSLQQILDWQKQMAGGAWDLAKGVYDEGMGLVNKRRGQFSDQFATAKDSILDTYEEKRGELQAVGQGASERLRNSLRALGLGGSAFIRGKGRQTQNEARAFGALQKERGTNYTANQSSFDEKNIWADAQESSLGRFIQGAQGQYDLAGKQQGVLDSVLSNIAAAQNSMGGVNTGTAGYNSPDFGSNYSDIATTLNSALPSFGGVQSQSEPMVNMNLENLSFFEKLKRGLLV